MRRFSDRILKTIVFIGTPLLFTAWVCYFYPWLEYMENESFFCFLPSWLGSFFVRPGGFGELLSRFFIQFFAYRPAILAVTLVLGVLLFFSVRAYGDEVISCRMKRGRTVAVCAFGALWFLPFWLLAWRDTGSFSLAVAYWLNMMAVWASLHLCGLSKSRKTSFGPFLVFFLVCLLMYYLTGPVSLIYVFSMAFLKPWWGLSGVGIWLLAAFLSSTFFVYPIQTALGRNLWQRNKADLCLQRIFARSENMAEHQQWDRLVNTASAYFDLHPEEPQDADLRQLQVRELLAVNLKLALLKSGRLNSQFFSYSHIYEMNQFLPVSFFAGEYNFPNMRFAWHLGLFVPMRIYTNNMLNVNGLQNATLRKIVPNSIFLQRYDLASNYLYYLSHTLFYAPEAERWQASNSRMLSMRDSFFVEQRSLNTDRMQEEGGTNLDNWVELMYTPRSNKDMLEYYTFLQLFYKNIEKLPALVEHYRRLGYNRLPDYVQEGLLILQDYEPESRQTPQSYSDFAYSPRVLNGFTLFRRHKKLYETGSMKFENIMKTQGSTYAFHYYFRGFLYR